MMRLKVGKTYIDRKDRIVTILSHNGSESFPYVGSNKIYYDNEGYASVKARLPVDLVEELTDGRKPKETEMKTPLFPRGQLFQYLGVIVLSSGEGINDNTFAGTVVSIPSANPLGYIVGEYHRSWAKSDWKPYDGILKVQLPPFKFGDKVLCKGESHSIHGVIVSDGIDKSEYYKVLFKGDNSHKYKSHGSLEPDV